jgi:hypothetical protein
MAGNTRGKLKEHFEGVHKNLDWSLHHINSALALIVSQIKVMAEANNLPITDEQALEQAKENPLYRAIESMGEGLQTFDSLASDIYAKL